MGNGLSEFTTNYSNQISRRISRERFQYFNRHNDYTYYDSTDQIWYEDGCYYDDNDSWYVQSDLDYGIELSHDSLYLENLLYDGNGSYIDKSVLTCYAKPPDKFDSLPKEKSYYSCFKTSIFNDLQNIKEIRLKDCLFKDTHFPPQKVILGGDDSNFLKNFRKKDQLKWERTKNISYYKGKTNQFVLDSYGKQMTNYTSLERKFFSSGDIFQGCLGSCFFLAALLGITKNLELISHIMPLDNAIRKNVEKGAFHFRFWKLGSWYSVIIDDYLPVDMKHNVLFTRNLSCDNEYWICLIEKAFAKFAGSYDKIHGGFMEDAALSLSGGIYDVYHTEIILNVSHNKEITDRFSIEHMKRLQKNIGNNLKRVIPTVNEFFEILKFAIESKNIIGCSSVNVSLEIRLNSFY